MRGENNGTTYFLLGVFDKYEDRTVVFAHLSVQSSEIEAVLVCREYSSPRMAVGSGRNQLVQLNRIENKVLNVIKRTQQRVGRRQLEKQYQFIQKSNKDPNSKLYLRY